MRWRRSREPAAARPTRRRIGARKPPVRRRSPLRRRTVRPPRTPQRPGLEAGFAGVGEVGAVLGSGRRNGFGRAAALVVLAKKTLGVTNTSTPAERVADAASGLPSVVEMAEWTHARVRAIIGVVAESDGYQVAGRRRGGRSGPDAGWGGGTHQRDRHVCARVRGSGVREAVARTLRDDHDRGGGNGLVCRARGIFAGSAGVCADPQAGADQRGRPARTTARADGPRSRAGLVAREIVGDRPGRVGRTRTKSWPAGARCVGHRG